MTSSDSASTTSTTRCSSASGPPNTTNPVSTRPSMKAACEVHPGCCSSGSEGLHSGPERRSTTKYIMRCSTAPLTLDDRPDPPLDDCADLAGVRMPAERRLRKDQLVVEGDLESSLRRGRHLDRGDDWRPPGEKFVRQTDGSGNVISGDAELDLQTMSRVEHGPILGPPALVHRQWAPVGHQKSGGGGPETPAPVEHAE